MPSEADPFACPVLGKGWPNAPYTIALRANPMRVIAVILMSSDTSMLFAGRLDRSDFGERRQYVGERSFPKTAQFVFLVGRPPGPQPTPSSACRVLKEADSVAEERVQGDPRSR